MEGKEPMDKLCDQLSAFHISMRLARAKNERLSVEQDGLSFMKERPNPWESLPSPNHGRRPCWEPPVLDYSWYEGLLGAEKELTTREGKKDAAWRTDVMDNYLEYNLLTMYLGWIQDEVVDAENRARPGKTRGGEEIAFWSPMLGKVWETRSELHQESHDIKERHGKSSQDWIDVKHRVSQIAEEMDPNFRGRIPRYFL